MAVPRFGTAATGNSVSTKTEQLQAMIAPAVEALGYEMWGVEYLSHSRPPLLRVFIDSANGINVEDCAAASRQISGVLDVEDPIDTEYTLEVSSPGMDRPLFTLDQFNRYGGEWVKLKLRVPFDGRRNFRGVLRGVEGDEVVLIVDDHEFLLPIELVDKANVVPQFGNEKSGAEKSTNDKGAKNAEADVEAPAATDAEENDGE
jgi:ribosome maturation factor RimP